MAAVVTLAARKASTMRRKRGAVEALRASLRAYARLHGGKFILFGSAARDDLRHHSDVDLLTDFSPERTSAAWSFAERECRRLALPADIKPMAYCDEAFLAHITDQCEILE